MSGVLSVRFAVRDKVFVADFKSSSPHTQCPDCLGQKLWPCALPSGEALSIPCPTCHYGWEGSRGWIAESLVSTPYVWEGTVGSVRVDTSDTRSPVTYMLEETGVGSGSVYDEDKLFAAESKALVVATIKAAERQADNDRAVVLARMRKRTDNPGSLVAYLHRDIRDARRQIERAQTHLDNLVRAPHLGSTATTGESLSPKGGTDDR